MKLHLKLIAVSLLAAVGLTVISTAQVNLNADNITRGIVADARIAASIARDSEVAAAYEPIDSAYTKAESDAAYDVLGSAAAVQADVDQNEADADAAVALKLDITAAAATYAPISAAPSRLESALRSIANGDRRHLNVIAIGDSLGLRALAELSNDLVRQYFPAEADVLLSSEPHTLASLGHVKGGTSALTKTEDVALRFVGGGHADGYDNSFIGDMFELVAGSGNPDIVMGLNNLGWGINGDTNYAFLVGKPGAGTAEVTFGDAADVVAITSPSGHSLTVVANVATVDLNTASRECVAIKCEYVNYSAGNDRNVRVTATAGTVQGLGSASTMEQDSKFAVNVYAQANGGLELFGGVKAPAADILSGLIAAYSADLIIVQSDDSLSSYQNGMPILKTAVDNCGLSNPPTVLLVGNFNETSKDYGSRAAYEQSLVADYGWHFANLAGMYTDAELIAGGVQGDGTHRAQQAYRSAMFRWALAAGLWRDDKQAKGFTVDFPSIAAGTTGVITVSLPYIYSYSGSVLVSKTTHDGLMLSADASGGADIEITAYNPTGAPIDASSTEVIVSVIKNFNF